MLYARVVFGCIAFVCGVVCAMASMFVLYDALDLVNEKLPKERQIGYFLWHGFKYLRLFENYKMFYPEGKLLRTHLKFTVMMFTCFVVVVVLVVWR
jgi:hypothetical protein